MLSTAVLLRELIAASYQKFQRIPNGFALNVDTEGNCMDFLTPLESESHPLLEPQTLSYSHATVRRAFIVWLRCGQKNDFKDVCKYYHYLEAMEDQLPADARATSRNHEFSLFLNPPPISTYQQEMFPNLYSPPLHHPYDTPYFQSFQLPTSSVKIEEIHEPYAKIESWKAADVSSQEIFAASQVFKAPEKTVKHKNVKLEVSEFLKQSAEAIKKDEIKKMNELNKACILANVDELKGTSKQDIVETSQMIKNYCKEQQVPLKNFLENFKEYATRCELTNTVNNVGFYIKRKLVHAELTLGVMVHRAKFNNGRTRTPPKPFETEADITETMTGQNKSKPVAKIAPLHLQNENDMNGTIENGTDNEDLISFDNTTGTASENVIRLLRREDELKSTAGFSNLHNIAMLDIQKCRKI
ncbi:hypothetical protein O0L34_g14701 [Tuta absoluta]|nr:hypothetical protein O0L34_g14701 [Tuta absoluta]